MTRNSEIGNTPFWVFPDIWRTGKVRDTKFSANVSNKKLLNGAKCQYYCFYKLLIINGKPTEGEVKNNPPPTLIRFNNIDPKEIFFEVLILWGLLWGTYAYLWTISWCILSLTYKISAIWLVEKSTALAVLHSWPQYCTL